MTKPFLEHVNITVAAPLAMANKLVEIFDWKIRWHGASKNNGTTVHVGTDELYLALYTPSHELKEQPSSYDIHGGLNHIGILVDDLDAMEARVIRAGYETHSHQTYEPGSRFYFHNEDGIEFEVVSYMA